ncbi:MAG: hypothetical protein PHV03_08350 [Desulfitobacteriaceae bacterium]|nr:hypothetical protein [Desulfitobacteriaceae bacterium]MDD4401940.1 hypothetical protein [Desulfitobacteriaceae bacterium]
MEARRLEVNYLNPCVDFEICKPEYYPLIPGRNLITVVTETQNYYVIVEIMPAQMSPFQWESMVGDLERILKGLIDDSKLSIQTKL